MQAEEFRQHFPGLRDIVHLCSCSQGAQSDRTIVAMNEFMNSWRNGIAPWDEWMGMADRAREAFAALINASPRDVAVVSCASEAAFQVASTQEYRPERAAIVTNDLEFPSIAHVWLAAQQKGAEVRFATETDGVVATEQYLELIDESVALVSVPLVTYANGMRFAVEEISQKAHQVGAKVVVDAYQGAGVIPIDVNTMGCDYLFSGALKYLLGIPGIAFLWTRPEVGREVEPILTGWFARQSPFAFTPRVLDYSPDARRFQTGTPGIAAAYASAAGLSLINETDPRDVLQHVETLADVLQEGLIDLGYDLYSPLSVPARGPQVAVYSQNPEPLSAFLKARHIYASPRGRAIRLSLHFYNNVEDVKRTIQAFAAFRDEHPRSVSVL
ncbi:aminotransferase class V-fold PLP-dependent enzyme [Sulfobacillus harzensis]|uniref:aminotransferase class V-fold PLP-dependent enzyme n=1 Tax=Sulfobacillus harzensis TaxID=2729629 RepID=UPI001A9B2B81